MKRYLCGLLLGGLTLAAFGQEGGGQTSEFRLLNATGSQLAFNLDTGQVEGIKGGDAGAELELIPADPARPPMRVRANDIGFKYSGDSTEPDTLLLNGNVNVNHPQGNIVAQKGEWDRRSGALVFHGNPVVLKRKEGGDLSAPTVTFNMETGQMTAEGGFQLRNMPLTGVSGAGGSKQETQSPYLLTVKDVKDWPALIGSVKRQAAGAAPAPGKQVLAQFDPKLRQQFNSVTDTQTPNQSTQADLVKALNRALREKDLYDAEAWKGIDLGPDAGELLKKESLSSEEVVRLNRRLLEAAYPDAITRRD